MFPHSFDISGKTALVTGGSAGLGYAMAKALLETGARVMLVGRSRDALEAAAEKLRSDVADADILIQDADLYERDSTYRLAEQALARTSGIDIFVGNAGAVHGEQMGNLTSREIDRAIELNLTSNIILSQEFSRHMRDRKWGRIIYSSSTASNLAAPRNGNIVYSAAKSGINGFARSIAADLGRDGITVNCIILGVFWTSILTNAVKALREADGEDNARKLIDGFVEMTALGRLGDPDDLAGLVQFLASDAGAYFTGLMIPADGGTSIMMHRYPDFAL